MLFTGYCFLTNGPTPGTTNELDRVKKDLQSMRNLLLTANENIFALQRQLAVANKAISSLQQESLRCNATIGKLTQNQTNFSTELKQINGNRATQIGCGCRTEIDDILKNQTQLAVGVKVLNGSYKQINSELASMKGNISVLQNSESELLQNISKIQTDVSHMKDNFTVVNKTIQNLNHTESALKNNTALISTLQEESIQCRNKQQQLSFLLISLQQQQQQQQQHINHIPSMISDVRTMKGNFSALQHGERDLLQNLVDVKNSISAINGQYAVVNNTSQRVQQAESLIKNNSAALAKSKKWRLTVHASSGTDKLWTKQLHSRRQHNSTTSATNYYNSR